MDSKRAIDAVYESFGQDFEDYKTFKEWLFQNTTPKDEHNFCWKDKMNDLPWEVLRAPAAIPKFRLEYGRKVEEKKVKKRKRSQKSKEEKGGQWPMQRELAAVQKLSRMRADAAAKSITGESFISRNKRAKVE